MIPQDLKTLVNNFAVEGKIEKVAPLGDGFINDTFIVRTSSDSPDYILQRKNNYIFPDVPGMMDNIDKVCCHIRKKVIAAGGDPLREVMTVVPTKDGKLYFKDETGSYWAVTVFIRDTIAYNRADTPELARKGGIGIGKFQALLADFSGPLVETIKGFHNISVRFDQWDASIAADTVGRVAELSEEICWIESRRKKMEDYRRMVDEGLIPIRVTHNDTKINNILFDHKGDVLCVIDLDTVMPAPVHNDFGDAIRTYTNTGDEDDKCLDRVGISLPMFEAYTDGYLSQQASVLTEIELEYLAFSAIYITYEQVLRFLMDYIDGDKYYKIKNPLHNLERSRAQYKLLQSMEENYDRMCEIVKNTAAKYKK